MLGSELVASMRISKLLCTTGYEPLNLPSAVSIRLSCIIRALMSLFIFVLVFRNQFQKSYITCNLRPKAKHSSATFDRPCFSNLLWSCVPFSVSNEGNSNVHIYTFVTNCQFLILWPKWRLSPSKWSFSHWRKPMESFDVVVAVLGWPRPTWPPLIFLVR